MGLQHDFPKAVRYDITEKSDTGALSLRTLNCFKLTV
jgi:hypothetical protein